MTQLDVSTALDLLRHGEIAVEGRLVDASNATLFCEISLGLHVGPVRLQAGRRRAARCGTSRTARWPAARSRRTPCRRRPAGTVVPPTVLREGPFGPGMVQLWIDTVDGADDQPWST